LRETIKSDNSAWEIEFDHVSSEGNYLPLFDHNKEANTPIIAPALN